MTKNPNPLSGILPLCLGLCLLLSACSNSAATDTPGSADSTTQGTTDATSDRLSRGQYLVNTIGSCNDCHSPKVFTSMGPMVDTTRLLSGYPANSKQAPVSKEVLKPGGWAYMAQDATSFAGPWGISYSANLTPDSATGIGAWSEETFINTIRTGKHLGQPAGRPILPPMPWYFMAKMTDDDLKSIYVYLQSIPAVSNRVPAPVTPDELAKRGGN